MTRISLALTVGAGFGLMSTAHGGAEEGEMAGTRDATPRPMVGRS